MLDNIEDTTTQAILERSKLIIRKKKKARNLFQFLLTKTSIYLFKKQKGREKEGNTFPLLAHYLNGHPGFLHSRL